ncbi:MAG: S-adenosylmethionine decarboxylase family protein [Micromonosporaceae bacterium]
MATESGDVVTYQRDTSERHVASGAGFGVELVLDLYGCDPGTIRSRESLTDYVRRMCQLLRMNPYGEPWAERFGLNEAKTAGYTVVQLIETSSITGHFSEERNAAYLNIFSCREFDVADAVTFSREFFAAESVTHRVLVRR